MRIKKGDIQVFSISFLDVLSCALGAVIILLVIAPTTPATPETKVKVVQKLQAIIKSLKDESNSLEKQINNLQKENKELKKEKKKTVVTKPKRTPAPSLFGLPLKADHAIFLVDVSPSMLWQIDNLYETVSSLLNSCEVKQYRFIYFDAIVYNSGRYWRHGWLKGTPENKKNSLRDTKSQLIGSLYLSLEGTTNVMNRLARMEMYGDNYITVEEIVSGLEKVTARDIQSLAEFIFIPEKLILTAVGPITADDLSL